jgi:hypothetical protein
MVLLWLDANTPLAVAKSIFQTAAFAGYPNESFAVHPKGNPDQIAQINADAIVPGPAGSQMHRGGDPFALHVGAVAGNPLSYAWRAEGEVLSSVELTERVDGASSGFPLLAAKLTGDWAAHGGHPLRGDRDFDRAVLHASGTLTVQTLIVLMDAIYSPSREVVFEGNVRSVSAFNLSLSVN